MADTQIQNRQAWAARSLLRTPEADQSIAVTIRPPALDLTARNLLRAHLAEQQSRGVSAIFYLGDGSNQGCKDELESTKPGEEGIFPILRQFSDASGIPVFFVLGNHDFLAAGNTENPTEHAKLCGGEGNAARKAELIGKADAFNRKSADKAGWAYRSSPSDALGGYCAGPGQQELRQSRRQGCYYTATLDVAQAGRSYRFLLLDTNDYPDVSRNRVLAWGGNTALTTDFEGLRGAMSFGAPKNGIENQTGWLAARGKESRDGGKTPDVLVALTHYNVSDLRKMFKIALSSKTQRIGDVFVDQAGPFYRERAFVISAHTHTPLTARDSRGIFEGKTKVVRLDEVNIGSTTDYPSLSAVLRIVPSPNGLTLSYEPLTPSRETCRTVARDLDEAEFPHAFLGNSKGGRAIALDAAEPLLYHQVTEANFREVFANIDWFVGTSSDRAICLGLMAGAIEAGKPLNPPRL